MIIQRTSCIIWWMFTTMLPCSLLTHRLADGRLQSCTYRSVPRDAEQRDSVSDDKPLTSEAARTTTMTLAMRACALRHACHEQSCQPDHTPEWRRRSVGV